MSPCKPLPPVEPSTVSHPVTTLTFLMAPLRERVWFLSPAIATGLFFLLQAILAFSNPHPTRNLQAAAAETPSPTHVKVRVVEQIRALDARVRTPTRVPTTERELLELFHRDGAVVFFQDEVEVVETSEKKFDPEVITLRKAKLERGEDRSSVH